MDDFREVSCRYGNTVKDVDGTNLPCGTCISRESPYDEFLFCEECLEDQAEAEGERWAAEGEPEFPRFR